jgi:hypothetical protein
MVFLSVDKVTLLSGVALNVALTVYIYNSCGRKREGKLKGDALLIAFLC